MMSARGRGRLARRIEDMVTNALKGRRGFNPDDTMEIRYTLNLTGEFKVNGPHLYLSDPKP